MRRSLPRDLPLLFATRPLLLHPGALALCVAAEQGSGVTWDPDGRQYPAVQAPVPGDPPGEHQRNGQDEHQGIGPGHGAYLGPDYTADYLRRYALSVRESYGGEGSDEAAVRTVEDFKENRYDPESRTLEFTAAQAAAFEELRGYYGDYFGEPTTRYGLRPEAIEDSGEIQQLTAYLAWTAWAAAALRPGLDYTYTNNWPPEPLVENEPTGEVVVWSVLSLVALLGGIGLLFAAFGRWNFLGWRGASRRRSRSGRPATLP
jgi:nitric oxide reductase subunit B